MTHATFLRGEHVELCALTEDDLPFAQRVVNHPEVRPGVSTFRPHTMADEREWYEEQGDGDHALMIRVEGDRVGIAGTHEHHKAWGVAEVGYHVHPDQWGNGYATEAARLLVDYGFRECRYAKQFAHVFETNPASRRVLEKVGLEHEATFDDQCFLEGERVDLERYAVHAEEWLAGDTGSD